MTRASKPPATRHLDPDVQLLTALADPVRLAIVRELAASNEVCACDFTTCCDVRQPTVSHHLRVLKEAGVVEAERQGSNIFYRLQPSAAARLASIAREILPGNLIPLSEVARRPARAEPQPPIASGGSSQRRSTEPEPSSPSKSSLASAPFLSATSPPVSSFTSSLKSGS